MKKWFTILFVGLVALMIIASANSTVTTCPHTGDWVKVDGLSGKTYTYTAPAGKLVSDVCYKHSTFTHSYGVNPPASPVTVTADEHCEWNWSKWRWDCHQYDLSHASFKLVNVSTPTPTATPTNTPETPTATPETPTATPTVIVTEQVEPTPTQVPLTPTPPQRCVVRGDIWYECKSGAWLYGTGLLRDCTWCGGLTGRRVVRESYDCGNHWTWYDNGVKVDDPPQELGRYPCPGNCK